MKQLLIVNKSAAYNAKAIASGSNATPFDLSNLASGAIVMFELDATSVLSAGTAPVKDFAIALGRPNNSPAFLIPEVNINTLQVTKAVPVLGNVFSAVFTIPTPTAGKTYTIVLVKKGTVPGERNTWTATETIPTGTTVTAAQLATKLAASLNAAGVKGTGAINIDVTVASAQVTIAGTVIGEQWEVKLGDDLYGTSVTTTVAKDTIGDKKYVQKLAQECAAGKGFTDVYPNGATIYPGYPEAVEDLTPNSTTSGSSTEGYAIYTLRFAVPRVASKTRDEVVSQLVHIAVPVSNSSYSNIDTMLTTASKYLTKAVADTLYKAAT